MTWVDEWQSIAARIDGLVRAVELHVEILKVKRDSDSYGIVSKSIIPELMSIKLDIDSLITKHGDILPASAVSAIQKYRTLPAPEPDLTFGSEANLQFIVALVAFRSEFEYCIRDMELEGRNRTELAFEHLRRLIVVDDDIKEKWKRAFDTHETACKKLGAVHLLNHGIWAFKIAGTGAATDLVYQEPLDAESMVLKRTARALVLTEWKRVTNPTEIASKAEEARKQTDGYKRGILGGAELKDTRYVIFVTKKEEKEIADVVAAGITYRHICIPVMPPVTSVEARRRSRRKTRASAHLFSATK